MLIGNFMQNYAEDRCVISSKNNRVIFSLLIYMLHPDSVCNDYFTEWQIFYLLNDIPGLGHDNGPGVCTIHQATQVRFVYFIIWKVKKSVISRNGSLHYLGLTHIPWTSLVPLIGEFVCKVPYSSPVISRTLEFIKTVTHGCIFRVGFILTNLVTCLSQSSWD